MNKKGLLILILFTIITLSGCSANYTLTYENDTFTETVNVRGEETDQAHPSYEKIKENGYHADVEKKELFTLDYNSTKNDVTLTHELQDVKLDKLKAVHECFGLYKYDETEESYYLSLYGDYYCSYLEDSTFTLETDSVVTLHNAHRVEKNKYIWDLDEEKIKDSGIKFQVMKSTIKDVKVSGNTMLPLSAKILILILIVGVTGGFYVMAKRANER